MTEYEPGSVRVGLDFYYAQKKPEHDVASLLTW